MTDQEWEQFLSDLEICGFSDTVQTFRQAEKEVNQKLMSMSDRALELIEQANVTQHVDEADKEGRYVKYLNSKGGLIIH